GGPKLRQRGGDVFRVVYVEQQPRVLAEQEPDQIFLSVRKRYLQSHTGRREAHLKQCRYYSACGDVMSGQNSFIPHQLLHRLERGAEQRLVRDTGYLVAQLPHNLRKGTTAQRCRARRKIDVKDVTAGFVSQ